MVRRYEDLRAVLFHASNQLRGLATSEVSECRRELTEERRGMEGARLESGSARYIQGVYQGFTENLFLSSQKYRMALES